MKIVYNDVKNCKKTQKIDDFSLKIAEKVKIFHQTFDEYDLTPLVELKNLARELNVKDIFVKDESKRFGLNAFKVLGGSYAIAKEIQKRFDLSDDEISFKKFASNRLSEKIKNLTFVTATDGNHGRGVAWSAQKLGANAIVYMPKGSAKERFDNIIKTGAKCVVTDCNYDDTVRVAKDEAAKHDYVFVQDTAFENYVDIPLHIMQGYMTLALEAHKQLKAVPTHIFVQAGVGSLSGAMKAFFANVYGKNKPKLIVVEPNNAGCIFKTAKANDGKLHFVKGELKTIMAGLSCGEPCSIGYEILHCYADAFIKIGDGVAKKAMKKLAFPVGDDQKIVSGESGCAGFAAALDIIQNEDEIKTKLGIDKKSVLLFVNTEGDTDKENYNKIVYGTNAANMQN